LSQRPPMPVGGPFLLCLADVPLPIAAEIKPAASKPSRATAVHASRHSNLERARFARTVHFVWLPTEGGGCWSLGSACCRGETAHALVAIVERDILPSSHPGHRHRALRVATGPWLQSLLSTQRMMGMQRSPKTRFIARRGSPVPTPDRVELAALQLSSLVLYSRALAGPLVEFRCQL
jgi:hypothetical protein